MVQWLPIVWLNDTVIICRVFKCPWLSVVWLRVAWLNVGTPFGLLICIWHCWSLVFKNVLILMVPPCLGLNHIYLIDLSMSLLIILHLFHQLLLMVYHKVLYLVLYLLFFMFLNSQILFLLIILTHYPMQMILVC